MAVTSSTVGDYYNFGWNMVTGVPKSGYTPAVGHFVRRETAATNEWDLITANEVAGGLVEAVSPDGARMTIALPVPDITVLIVEHDNAGGSGGGGAIALGDKLEGTATALGTTVARTVLTGDQTNGKGRVIALNPAGTNTAAWIPTISA